MKTPKQIQTLINDNRFALKMGNSISTSTLAQEEVDSYLDSKTSELGKSLAKLALLESGLATSCQLGIWPKEWTKKNSK